MDLASRFEDNEVMVGGLKSSGWERRRCGDLLALNANSRCCLGNLVHLATHKLH